jgi:hypothetical protein
MSKSKFIKSLVWGDSIIENAVELKLPKKIKWLH